MTDQSRSKQQKLRRARLRNSLPTAYPRMVMEIAAEHGVEPERVLEGTRLTQALLDTPELRVSAKEASRVTFNALELTGDLGLGLEFGLRTRPTAHGYLGYAVMSCSTLGEAMQLVLKYAHIRQRDFGISSKMDRDTTVITITDKHDLGPLRSFYLEGLTIGIMHIASFLLGEPELQGELWFDWSEPDYFAKYRKRLWFVRFNKPQVQIRFPAEYLQQPLVMADPVAVKQAVVLCERELVLTGPEPDNILDRVRAELRPSTEGYPNLDTVAACLFMSGRSLKRKLSERGSSFKILLDEARYTDAVKLMENPDLDISQICTALGYKDPPSFTRAFKRWSGMTPSDARHQVNKQASAAHLKR